MVNAAVVGSNGYRIHPSIVRIHFLLSSAPHFPVLLPDAELRSREKVPSRFRAFKILVADSVPPAGRCRYEERA